MSDERKKHERDGYCVALFHGYATDVADGPGGEFMTEQVLVEVVELYNAWGQPESQRYHYRAWELALKPREWEIKTIGGIFFDPASQEPPSFVRDNVRDDDGQPFTWRRLR